MTPQLNDYRRAITLDESFRPPPPLVDEENVDLVVFDLYSPDDFALYEAALTKGKEAR